MKHQTRLLLILAACVLSTGCQRERKVIAATRVAVAVRTVSAVPAAQSETQRYSGTVEPDAQVDLYFRVSGYVDQIATLPDLTGRAREIREGDIVAAGTVLARLRSSEYQTKLRYADAVSADSLATLAALNAQLHESEASLRQAELDFSRAETLFNEKAMTKVDFDAAEARRDGLKAKKQSVEGQIASQQARIRGAAEQKQDAAIAVDDTALRAPFPAVVVAKKIARGSLAGAGMPAFVLADLRTVRVRFGAPDLALSKLKTATPVSIRVEACPGRDFAARIGSVSASADTASRLFDVEAITPNPHHDLKAGMVATVIVGDQQQTAPLPSIPIAAVLRGNDSGTFAVYKIESLATGHCVRKQSITLGKVEGNSVLISAGLKVGDRVVSQAGLQLADGEPVELIP